MHIIAGIERADTDYPVNAVAVDAAGIVKVHAVKLAVASPFHLSDSRLNVAAGTVFFDIGPFTAGFVHRITQISIMVNSAAWGTQWTRLQVYHGASPNYLMDFPALVNGRYTGWGGNLFLDANDMIRYTLLNAVVNDDFYISLYGYSYPQ
jgi:hypothetical protein